MNARWSAGVLWLPALLLAAQLGAWGCDEKGGDTVADSGSDTGSDAVEETYDPLNPPCTYPAAEYAFSAIGDIAPMMYWPSSIAGVEESVPANFGYIRCLEGVHSIFIFIYGES
jgi:hypothetical protein